MDLSPPWGFSPEPTTSLGSLGCCRGRKTNTSYIVKWACSGKIQTGASQTRGWPERHQLGQKGPFRDNLCSSPVSETQKELKWPKIDSKVTRADRAQSDPKLTQKWLRTPFLSHLWVTFGSLGFALGWDGRFVIFPVLCLLAYGDTAFKS